MSDIFPKKIRHKIMRAVKHKGNKSTELRLIVLLKKYGLSGWRRSYKLQGKPDFVFPKKRIVVFTDGCFWHGHPCRNIKPVSNYEFWKNKISRNQVRDRVVTCKLRKESWIVIRIWECELKQTFLPKRLLNKF